MACQVSIRIEAGWLKQTDDDDKTEEIGVGTQQRGFGQVSF